jgi:hypothetical protein
MTAAIPMTTPSRFPLPSDECHRSSLDFISAIFEEKPRRRTVANPNLPLFSCSPFPSPGFPWKKRAATVGLCRGCAIRKRKGHGGERENRDATWVVTVAGRDYCSCAITVAVMGKFWTTHNFVI